MLKALAGLDKEEAAPVDIEGNIRAEIVQNITAGLMQLAGGNGQGLSTLAQPATSPAASTTAAPAAATNGSAPAGDFMAPWLDTDDCTSCDECIAINPNIFQYNDAKKAFIKDPNAGPYKDLVKAAEKCTAQVIHPGLPADRSEKGIEKLIKRGEKFN